MSAFKTASKLIVEELDKRKLHHVPSDPDSKILKLLSVVEDGIIKEWSAEDLQFEPDPYDEELSRVKRNKITDVDGTLSAELQGVFACSVNAGDRVTYEADFDKFRWRKLKNYHSLIKHLKSGVFSTSKKSGKRNRFRAFLRYSDSFDVVTSVVHTTSPTKIILLYESEFAVSAKVNDPTGKMFKGKARLGRINFDRREVVLPPDTAIAYECVNVLILKDGSTVVTANVFDWKGTWEQPSSTSAGPSLPLSGDASSTSVQDDSQTNEENDSLRKLVSVQSDEITRQKLYASSLLQVLSDLSVDKKEDSGPPSSSDTSTTTEIPNLQEKHNSLAMELKEKYEDADEESRELKELCARQEEVIAGLKTKISTLLEQINQHELKIENMDKRHVEGLADQEKRHKETIADQEKRHNERLADQEKRFDARIKESHDSAIYTMSRRLDKITQQVSQTTKTDDGQARASSQRIPRIPRASRQGEHQEASISFGTSPTEGDNLVEGRLLGKGGFGSVYLQFDRHTNEMVAVKIIHIEPVDSQVSRQFKRIRNEIAVMERLDHVRIVKYIRSEIRADSFYIYMEYMCGGSVTDQLQRSGALNEDTTKKYTRQILEGLDYLHKKGIIHRDIKGSNVLCDGEGNVKLADFGISKRLSALETKNENRARTDIGKHTGQTGSVYWMAPEVIRGEKYGRRADIWSTGVTMIEMLTTRPPWYNYESYQAMFKIATSKKPSYLLDDPAISRDAKNFLDLTFQPEEERLTAEELLQRSWLQM